MEAIVQRARSAAARLAAPPPATAELLRAAVERSKDLASEASNHIRGFAKEAAATVAAVQMKTWTPKNEQELETYGITPQLRDFVQGLTIDTFRDFPLDDDEMDKAEQAEASSSDAPVLTPWQEQHARLVLSEVPEIAAFRYELCPKCIKEKRFWRIYFTLVDGHIATKYTTPSSGPASSHDVLPLSETQDAPVPMWSSAPAVEELLKRNDAPVEGPLSAPAAERNRNTDEDLDAYLLGSSDDDEPETDASFDAEFDKLVIDSALESDGDSS